MAEQHTVQLSSSLIAQVRFSGVPDGDFRVKEPQAGIEQRRSDLVDLPWSWIRQVHGTTVLAVDEPGQHAGATADGLLTTAPGCPIAVTTADCAPLVLLAAGGLAVVHAGWRGLMDGIVGSAAELLGTAAGRPVATLLGPCIGPGAYEFGSDELDRMRARFGPGVESITDDGRPALDLPATVGLACAEAGWPVPPAPICTSGPQWFSHRTRRDEGRQTAVAWLENGTG